MSGEERTRAQAVLADYLALARSALDELVGVLARDGATAEREGFRERIGAQLDATRAALAPLAERAPLRRVEHPRARGAQADLARALDQAAVAGRAVAALLAAETVATELAEPTLARELHRMRREQEAYVRYLERLVGKLTRAAVRDEVGRDTVRALHAELARSTASERRGHRSGSPGLGDDDDGENGRLKAHQAALRAALDAERAGHEALLAGRRSEAEARYRDAAAAYFASWRSAPPESYGRLIGYVKCAVLAGSNAAAAGRTALDALKAAGVDLAGVLPSPACAYAVALAALAAGERELARRAAAAMAAGGGAFERTAAAIAAIASGDSERYEQALAAIVRDFEQRDDHLTGIAIADTAVVLRRLGERSGLGTSVASPLLPS
ncbi:hypothetical protein JDY09_03660 [Thermoleophilum album]|jgi:hypothetical protein|uniref:hypothetical protein n=1 Tax=Thermoleophilum album TaxID=29539 RepID=UPI00237C7758|nr:hypothetical protein [Thermoleophilum album]WDT94356.1 hypothetical protein JDY09_03660 [Thermoleophilum album]